MCMYSCAQVHMWVKVCTQHVSTCPWKSEDNPTRSPGMLSTSWPGAHQEGQARLALNEGTFFPSLLAEQSEGSKVAHHLGSYIPSAVYIGLCLIRDPAQAPLYALCPVYFKAYGMWLWSPGDRQAWPLVLLYSEDLVRLGGRDALKMLARLQSFLLNCSWFSVD